MKIIIIMLYLFLIILLVNPVFCQQRNSTQQAPMVNLELKDMLVKDAFETLFKGTNIKYEFVMEQNPQNIIFNDFWTKNKISVKLTNVPFTEAVKVLSRSAFLKFIINKTGEYHFSYDPFMGVNQNQMQNQNSGAMQKRDVGNEVSNYGGYGGNAKQKSDAPAKTERIRTNYSAKQLNLGNKDSSLDNPKGGNPVNPGVVKIEPTNGLKFDFTLDQANIFEVIRQVMDLSKKQYILDLGPASNMNQLTVPRITAKIQNVTLDEFMNILKKSSGVQVINAGRTIVIKWRPTSRPIRQINKN